MFGFIMRPKENQYFRYVELDSIEIQLKSLPEVAGVYQYYDKQDKIIYIGKAKNLKKRVASYFNKSFENYKTKILVKNINRIEHVVVDSETKIVLESILEVTLGFKKEITLRIAFSVISHAFLICVISLSLLQM